MGNEPVRVMLDIETLGVDPGAAIISIGACRFELGFGWTQEELYVTVDRESCTDHGLHIEEDTLSWWRDQDTDLAPLDGGEPLPDALAELRAFVEDADELWANSPKFDMAMLEAAYDAVDTEVPWAFHELRDVRTVRALPGAVELDMTGREHHALDDARHQADEVAETLSKLNAEPAAPN
jgi:hypothetical protein